MAKFRMVSRRRYSWPVTVRFPDPDPNRAGEIVEQTFTVLFEEMPRDEARALQDEIEALPPREQEERQHDMLVAVIKGWGDDIVDHADQPIPFSEAALREGLQSSFLRIGLYRAYVQSLTGEAARKGN